MGVFNMWHSISYPEAVSKGVLSELPLSIAMSAPIRGQLAEAACLRCIPSGVRSLTGLGTLSAEVTSGRLFLSWSRASVYQPNAAGTYSNVEWLESWYSLDRAAPYATLVQ